MNIVAKVSQFAGNTFAFWVLFFALFGFFYPNGFTWIGPYISILLGVVMFGMGITLTLDDFKQILKQPKKVLLGVSAQYIIMPLLAFSLAVLLQLPPEVAAGVILVGCCPGGTASNVITYLAKGNTALSVAITAVSTLLAPILTPLLTLLLASKWLPISAGSLFISIVKIVIIPIVLGILVRIFFKEQVERGIQVLPLISVIAIVAIVAAVVGLSKEKLMETGLLIFAVVMLHNILGLLIGYWIAKFFKLDVADQKAISIEVGMQNSGLGAALAAAHFSPIAAVPSAIFSVWHNLSGPFIATIWGKEKNRPSHETIDKGISK